MDHPIKKQKVNYIYNNYHDIRCELCKSKLQLLNYGEFCKLPNGNINWSFSLGYLIDLCCTNCETYYAGCTTCSHEKYLHSDIITPDEDCSIVLCQFLNCEVADPNYKGTLLKYDEEEEVDILDFSQRNQFYIHLKDPDMTSDGICGPDGGLSHLWKCHKCGELISGTDK
jgi:hypothetical protein